MGKVVKFTGNNNIAYERKEAGKVIPLHPQSNATKQKDPANIAHDFFGLDFSEEVKYFLKLGREFGKQFDGK